MPLLSQVGVEAGLAHRAHSCFRANAMPCPSRAELPDRNLRPIVHFSKLNEAASHRPRRSSSQRRLSTILNWCFDAHAKHVLGDDLAARVDEGVSPLSSGCYDLR